jgi:hypothetical protein
VNFQSYFKSGAIALPLLIAALSGGCAPKGTGDATPPASAPSAVSPEAKSLIEARRKAIERKPAFSSGSQKADAVLERQKELKLTEKQKTKIQAIQRDQREKIAALEKQARQDHEKAENLAKLSNEGKGVTLQQVRKSLTAAAKTSKLLKEARERAWEDVRDTLTPDQRQTLEKTAR